MDKTVKALVLEVTGFFAEKKKREKAYSLPKVVCKEEQPSEEALKNHLKEQWGIAPKKYQLLCVLPKKSKKGTEFVEYYYCTKENGGFEDAKAEEIALLDFLEKERLFEKNDALAVETYAKNFKPWILKETAREEALEKTWEMEAAEDEKGEADTAEEAVEAPAFLSVVAKDLEEEAEALEEEPEKEIRKDFEVWKPKKAGQKKESKLEPGSREGIDYEVWKPKKR